MKIVQTISELGLENKAEAFWAEPRAGQSLKPKFGSRPLSKKFIYSIFLLMIFFFFFDPLEGNIYSISFYIILPLLLMALAWPVLIILDRFNKRNVWVYQERIIISHARDKLVLPKTDIKKIVIYPSKTVSLKAIEFLLDNRKSIVVGIPNEVDIPALLKVLNSLGYPVQIIP